MRIGIFFSNEDYEVGQIVLKTLREGLRDLPNQVHAYVMGRCWERLDPNEISHNFQSLGIIVIVISRPSVRSRWLSFLTGFGIGSAKRVYRYCTDHDVLIPSYLSGFVPAGSLHELLAGVRYDSDILRKEAEIEDAREIILSSGRPISDEGFATTVVEGDLGLVNQFLRFGLSPDTRDNRGVPILSLAIRVSHHELIELLLSRGADINAVSADRGNSPLMEAAVREDELTVTRLLERHADPDKTSVNGQTALMMAIGQGLDGIARRLILSGANPDIVDQLGMSARKYATLFGRAEIVQLIDQHETKVETTGDLLITP